MNNKILDYSFLGVLSLFLFIGSIMVISKSSDSLQVGVGVLFILVVLGVGIGTFFLGNKVNMMSIAGVTVILFLIIFIYSILKGNVEGFITTPVGYKKIQGKFIPTYSSNMDNLNSDGKTDETKERISILENEIQNAEQSCSSLTSLQDEMMKYLPLSAL